MKKGKTEATKKNEIKRVWHLVDLRERTLGRISTEMARYLMGKHKPYYVRNLDCGDYVVAVNAKQVSITGNKELKKKYYRYSGYPGGLRIETLKELRQRRPEEIIYHAVKGMLPQNKLRDRMLKRLYVFQDTKHPYEKKFKI